jgi:hypothetical protein
MEIRNNSTLRERPKNPPGEFFILEQILTPFHNWTPRFTLDCCWFCSFFGNSANNVKNLTLALEC